MVQKDLDLRIFQLFFEHRLLVCLWKFLYQIDLLMKNIIIKYCCNDMKIKRIYSKQVSHRQEMLACKLIAKINFAQWRYTNQWSIREVVLLLVENYSQYPGRTMWNIVVRTNFWPFPKEAIHDYVIFRNIILKVIQIYFHRYLIIEFRAIKNQIRLR